MEETTKPKPAGKASDDLRAGMSVKAVAAKYGESEENTRLLAAHLGISVKRKRMPEVRAWLHRVISWRMPKATKEERNAVADYLMEKDGLFEWCYILNTPLYQNSGGDYAPALVAIDPHKPLAPGNAAIVSMRAARIKSDGTAEEHARIAVWMRSAPNDEEPPEEHDVTT